MTQPYPLDWPDNIRRTDRRVKSQFRTSLNPAMNNVLDSLKKFASDSSRKIENVVISSNVTLGVQKPADSGVAIWFIWDGDLRCIAVDKYLKVEENLQAVHHVLEARRTEVRHAGIEMTRATFRGFTPALPAPHTNNHWSTILGVRTDATEPEIQTAFKNMARKHSGTGQMSAINVARDQAVKHVTRGTNQ